MRFLPIYLLLFVLPGWHLPAQPTETFMTSFDPHPEDIRVDKGYVIWSIGDFVYLINGFLNDLGRRQQQLFKIDANTKEIVKMVEFVGPQNDIVIIANTITSDQHILLTGEWLDYDAGNIMRMFLAKLTPDLETVWINYYPNLSTEYLYSDDLTETEAGDYLIYLTEGIGPWPHTSAKLRIIKTDTLGNILFNKVLVDTFLSTNGFGDITPTHDGNFLVSSNVSGTYTDPQNGTLTVNAILHKIDPDANQLWSKSLGYVNFSFQHPTSTSLSGGGAAVMWMKDTATTDPGIQPDFPVMRGLDDEGESTWEHEWNTWGYYGVERIFEAKNGDILGVGFFQDPGAFTNKGKGWLFRTTASGEQLWERFYSDSLIRPWAPKMEMLDMCEMEDGRIAVTGAILDSISVQGIFNFNVVLLVLDSMGCMEPGCSGDNQYLVSASEPLFKRSNLPALNVFPNPSSGSFSVSLPQGWPHRNRPLKLQYLDQSGCHVQESNWPLFEETIRISDFQGAEGVYYLLLYEGNRPVAGGKMVIQN